MVDQQLPFPVSTRLWSDLPEGERGFFCFQDDYCPFHLNHAAQIALLNTEDAIRLESWAFAALPAAFPDRPGDRFEFEAVRGVYDCWNDPARRVSVRHWLFDRGIPFRRTVYLLYERHRVVQTTWRMVVRYWDAFAWSVGYAMYAVDHTLQWSCCFHHGSVIVFGSRMPIHRKRRGP